MAGGEKGKISLNVDGNDVSGQVVPLPEGKGNTVRVKVTVD